MLKGARFRIFFPKNDMVINIPLSFDFDNKIPRAIATFIHFVIQG